MDSSITVDMSDDDNGSIREFFHQWAIALSKPLPPETYTIPSVVFDALTLRYQDVISRSEDVLDPAIVPLLQAINDIPGFVTTWSCSGHPESEGDGRGYFTICVNEEGLEKIFDFIGRCQVFFQFADIINHPCGAELEEDRLMVNIPSFNFSFTTNDDKIRDQFLANLTEFVIDYKATIR